MEEVKRERLVDLTFAMRIVTKQFAEDMTVLLSSPLSEGNQRKSAERCSDLAQQVMRYTKQVEGMTRK